MTPSTRSAFSRRYVKSGRTRSTPGMSGSGNMMPQSRTRMRPSTSMQAQFRPISPRPPRKTTRTGFGLDLLPDPDPRPDPDSEPLPRPRSAKRSDRDRRWPDSGQDLLRLVVQVGGGGSHGQAALPHPQPERA